ncbi:MAG: sulfotransferase [Uliginosibacterium sp.]|nr:sulfotransferase [Uliginosibacterium sp.]
MINALQQHLGVKLYVVTLFDAPTIAGQALYLWKHFPEEVGAKFEEQRADRIGATGADACNQYPTERIRSADVETFRKLAAAWHRGESGDGGTKRGHSSRNPRMVFILTTPRSGSSLLRIMLAGHPHLFAPPELELLSFGSMQERRNRLGGGLSFMREGLVRAMMEIRQCDADRAAQIIAGHEARDDSTQQFFRLLQQWIGKRLLVDKSTTYSLATEILDQAEDAFEDNVYIHLVRHPCGTIRSFEEARLDRVLRFEGEDRYSVRQFAELTWIVSHQNILGFLSRVPDHRQIRVRFEDLIRDPRPIVEGICERLKVEFDPLLLNPYQHQERRMTDSVNDLSVGMTDPKFHAHKDINPEVADNWQSLYSEDILSESARQLAEELGYVRNVAGSALPGADIPATTLVPIEPLQRDLAIPPIQSYAQQRLWFSIVWRQVIRLTTPVGSLSLTVFSIFLRSNAVSTRSFDGMRSAAPIMGPGMACPSRSFIQHRP